MKYSLSGPPRRIPTQIFKKMKSKSMKRENRRKTTLLSSSLQQFFHICSMVFTSHFQRIAFSSHLLSSKHSSFNTPSPISSAEKHLDSRKSIYFLNAYKNPRRGMKKIFRLLIRNLKKKKNMKKKLEPRDSIVAFFEATNRM